MSFTAASKAVSSLTLLQVMASLACKAVKSVINWVMAAALAVVAALVPLLAEEVEAEDEAVSKAVTLAFKSSKVLVNSSMNPEVIARLSHQLQWLQGPQRAQDTKN